MVATVTTLGSASSTVAYYARDGLCRADDPVHYRASRWYGRGCETLNLGSHVDPEPFAAILQDPASPDDGPPGVDITFSAPKTVSLSALLRDDPRVVRNHDKAVRATLFRVEERLLFVAARLKGARRTRLVPAPGMVAATFRHHVNRNLDPQLHTHAVVASLVPGAVSGASLALPVLRRHALLIGAWYRNELARRLEDDGYAVMPVQRGGLAAFEILGWPRQSRTVFSSRRSEILEWVAERGWLRNAGTMRRAALATRRAKNEPIHADLVANWKRRAWEHGLAFSPSPSVKARTGLSAIAAVRAVAAELSAREPVFRHRDLVAGVLGRMPGKFSPDGVEAVIAGLAGDGHLVERTRGFGARAWILSGEDAAGARMLEFARAGVAASRPLASAVRVGAWIEASGLTADQGRALQALVLGRDRVLGLRIRSREGKAGLLRTLRHLVPGRPVIGLVPGREAVAAATLQTGVPVRSVEAFLARSADSGTRLQDLEGGIVVLDGAARVAPRVLFELVRATDELKVGRLMLMAGARECVAKGAGQVFQGLAEAGIPVLRIDDVPRVRREALHTADREDAEAGRTQSRRRVLGPPAHGPRMDTTGPDDPDRPAFRHRVVRLLPHLIGTLEGRHDGHRGLRRTLLRNDQDQEPPAAGSRVSDGGGSGTVSAGVRSLRPVAEKEPIDLVPPRATFAGTAGPGPGEWLRDLVGPGGLDLAPPAQAVAIRVVEEGPRSGWQDAAALILRYLEPGKRPSVSGVLHLTAVLIGARADHVRRAGSAVSRREIRTLANELVKCRPGPGTAPEARFAWRMASQAVRGRARCSAPGRDIRVANGSGYAPVAQAAAKSVRRDLAGDVRRLSAAKQGHGLGRRMRP